MSTDRSLQEALAGWDGEAVMTRFDRDTGSWFFVAVHDTTLGTPNGGTRMRVYDYPAAGLEDAMRLAEGMTRKWAVLGLPFGGGKAVLAVPRWPEADRREGLLLRYGGFLETLGGSFQTGVDLGTTPEDMLLIGRVTRNVHGVDFETGRMIDPGPFTAQGVLRGIEAALEVVHGDPTLEGRSVLVQGVGDVGEPLAGLLAERGARVLVSDLESERAGRVAAELGGEVVPPSEVVGHACDVYAPCAVGGVLTRETIPRLACRIVAGSANAQLGEPADADRLHARGVLYAPDYVVNGGGAAAFGLLSLGEHDEERIREQVDGIGETLRSIFGAAAQDGGTPVAAADRRVAEALSRGREPSVTRAPAR